MFREGISVNDINEFTSNCMDGHLGIEVTEIGKDFVKGKMPVDHRTKQPYGILHGGASLVLAESMGSLSASFAIDPTKQYCVGLDINANHVRSVRDGYVYATTKPLHVGRSTHVWEITITDEKDRLVCISRITMAIIDIKQ